MPVDLTMRVSKLGRHCDGVATVDGTDNHDNQKQHFVPYALPGELVRVRTVGKRARLLDVLKPSKDRVNPFCTHFGQCGGCTAQHLHSGPYRIWKRGMVQTALANRGLDVEVDDLIDAHGDGRRRVTLHVRFTRGRVLAGFMQAHSRELIDLEICPILTPALHDAPQIARILAAPFAAGTQQLDIAMTATPDGLDCDIRDCGNIGYDTHVALAERTEQCDIARVSIDGIVALERRKPVLSIGNLRVPLPPACFLQATNLGEETLARLVLAGIGNAKKIADLFCGVGPFALRLAPDTAIYAADSNQAAIAALSEAIRHGKDLKPVTTEVRDLFRNPLYRDDLKPFDVVIFNPARAGAEAQATELAASTVPVVICVSCDPASLARDAALLVAGGYRFERAMPVDQFKYSPHVETVAVFRRN